MSDFYDLVTLDLWDDLTAQNINWQAARQAEITTAVQMTLTLSKATPYASTTDMNLTSPIDGTWAFITTTGAYYHRESGAWVLRGSDSRGLPMTNAARIALNPIIQTKVFITDRSGLEVNYLVGIGWRTSAGGDPDYVAPVTQPDTGGY